MQQRLAVVFIFIVALALLAGCGQGPSAPAEVASVTETAVVVPTDTIAPPTNTPEPTATEAPTDTPEPTATAEPTFTPTPEVVVSNCLVCHGDQQMLINTAAPEEEAPEESESSGVG